MTLALLNPDSSPLLIAREPQGVAQSENELRDLLFAHPAMLPIHEIATNKAFSAADAADGGEPPEFRLSGRTCRHLFAAPMNILDP